MSGVPKAHPWSCSALTRRLTRPTSTLGPTAGLAGHAAHGTAHWLDRATALADGDDGELAAVLGVRGMDLSDQGRTGEAVAVLAESVE